MLVDHLVYAAPDLATAVADLEERFGVRAQAGGKHMGAGTHNALLSLGPRTYLEIIAPDPAQPEPPMPRPLGVDSVTHAGLVAWALACDDIDGMVAQARRRGYDPGEVSDGQRVAPAGTVLRWHAALNTLADALVPFLICWGGTEHPARSAPHGLVLESIQIEHPDPSALAPLLTALGADVEVKPAEAPALVAHLTGPNGSKVLR
ncbi:MAG: VOC family protein [Streptosporangiaceae bacterium]